MGWGPGQGRPGSLGPRPVPDRWLFQDTPRTAQLGLAEPHVVSCGHLPCQLAARLRPWLLDSSPTPRQPCLPLRPRSAPVGGQGTASGWSALSPESRSGTQREGDGDPPGLGLGSRGRAERRPGEKGHVRPTFAGSHRPRGGKRGSGAWRASLGPPVRELCSSLAPLLPGEQPLPCTQPAQESEPHTCASPRLFSDLGDLTGAMAEHMSSGSPGQARGADAPEHSLSGE